MLKPAVQLSQIRFRQIGLNFQLSELCRGQSSWFWTENESHFYQSPFQLWRWYFFGVFTCSDLNYDFIFYFWYSDDVFLVLQLIARIPSNFKLENVLKILDWNCVSGSVLSHVGNLVGWQSVWVLSVSKQNVQLPWGTISSLNLLLINYL